MPPTHRTLDDELDELTRGKFAFVFDLHELALCCVGLSSLLRLDHRGFHVLNKEDSNIARALHQRLSLAFDELTEPGAQG